MKNKKMKLQLFAQSWNPDNVTVFEHKDGTIPDKYNELIIKDVMEGSKVMQLAKYEEMDSKEKKFEYFAKGPGAYWVGEGEKIKTSKPQWLAAKMVAKKLGVIVPCSRELLHYKVSDFFEKMKPKIAEAFYKKFDEAVIMNLDNPFPQSLEESIMESGNSISTGLTYDNILALEDILSDEDFDTNAFISTKKNRSTLRNVQKIENGVVVETLYDRANNTLDGYPVVDLKSLEKGTLYAGDFDYMYYGIPYGMSYKVSEEAQLSTLTNEDGTPVNLFEQELVALRVTMDVAFMIVKDNAFAKLETSSKLGTLTVTSAAGTATGDTKVTISPEKGEGNSYKYKVADAEVEVKYGQNVKNWTAWDGSKDITAATGKQITVVECDAEFRAVKAGSAEVTAKSA
ncbi:MAG: phage major capsid protein [Clostridiales bacterium]|nr:phage major capsid protein [Clostridiales bacterium]